MNDYNASRFAGPVGRYKVVNEVAGVKLATPLTLRDEWKPGEQFGKYTVGARGELRRTTPKANFRTARHIRRMLRGLRKLATGGGSDDTVAEYATDGLTKVRRWRKEGGSL